MRPDRGFEFDTPYLTVTSDLNFDFIKVYHDPVVGHNDRVAVSVNRKERSAHRQFESSISG